MTGGLAGFVRQCISSLRRLVAVSGVAIGVAPCVAPGADAQTAARDSSPVGAIVAGTASDTLAARYQQEALWPYLRATFGIRPAVRAVALAGFDQWRRRPQAFPANGRGFADRLGSRYAQVAISHTLRFGLSRTFEASTFKYRPCACGDTSSRVAYALLAPFRVITPHGIRLSTLNPLTELASGILITPAHSGGLRIGEGLRNGLTGIAAESATSLIREFWPWHWRPPFL
jgi:hypothetical protein